MDLAGKEGGTTGSAEALPQGLVSPEAQERLQETPELDYLTHIVMRLFENKRCASELGRSNLANQLDRESHGEGAHEHAYLIRITREPES